MEDGSTAYSVQDVQLAIGVFLGGVGVTQITLGFLAVAGQPSSRPLSLPLPPARSLLATAVILVSLLFLVVLILLAAISQQ